MRRDVWVETSLNEFSRQRIMQGAATEERERKQPEELFDSSLE